MSQAYYQVCHVEEEANARDDGAKEGEVYTMSYYGFESEEELREAVGAWREMEGRAREAQMGNRVSKSEGRFAATVVYDTLAYVLQPVDDLDKAAGMKALEER